MRKILLSFFGAAIILFGCSKSSDSTSANISGTWNINKIVELNYENGVIVQGDTTTEGSLTFSSDRNYSITDNSGSGTGTYSYNSSSKKLIIAVTGQDPTSYNVTNLTSNNLHFTFDSTIVDNGETFRTTLDADCKR